MSGKKEIDHTERTSKVKEFWHDNANIVLTVTAAIGAGAAALLLVKTFFDQQRKRKESIAEAENVSMPQLVEETEMLGQEHGHEQVAAVAAQFAEHAESEEEQWNEGKPVDGDKQLSAALSAVAAIARQSKRPQNW